MGLKEAVKELKPGTTWIRCPHLGKTPIVIDFKTKSTIVTLGKIKDVGYGGICPTCGTSYISRYL